MIDEIEGLRIIVSGSSSFDINKNTGEPLTGRKYTFNLYAFSEAEYNQIEDNISKIDKIRERLIFGNYPKLIHIPDKVDKIDYPLPLLNREMELDFSPEYKIVGLKSNSSCHSIIRLINGTANDKKTVFTQPVKHGTIENQFFKPAE